MLFVVIKMLPHEAKVFKNMRALQIVVLSYQSDIYYYCTTTKSATTATLILSPFLLSAIILHHAHVFHEELEPFKIFLIRDELVVQS